MNIYMNRISMLKERNKLRNMTNKEKLFLLFVAFICFGFFIFSFNINLTNKILFSNELNIAIELLFCTMIGIFYSFIYFIIFASVTSWILNIVYIISYKLKGYKFISYNIYPIIFIKQNKRKIMLSFNILSLFEMYSMIDLNNKINNSKELDEFIENNKKVLSNLIYTHYVLILLGIIIGIFNIPLGGLIVSYNIAVLMYQSISNNYYLSDGYVYLSKNLCEKNIFYIINNLIKVQNLDKKFLYEYLQDIIIKYKLDNQIIDDFYKMIIIDSINEDYTYLSIESRDILYKNMEQEAYINRYSFLSHYRLYLTYSIYAFKKEDRDKYNSIKNKMNVFYENEKDNKIFRKIRMFKNHNKALNKNCFKAINLKNMFDICNIFDSYKSKLEIMKQIGEN